MNERLAYILLPSDVLAVLCKLVTSSLLNSICPGELSLRQPRQARIKSLAHNVRHPVELGYSHLARLFVAICYPDRVDATVKQGKSGRQQGTGQHYKC